MSDVEDFIEDDLNGDCDAIAEFDKVYDITHKMKAPLGKLQNYKKNGGIYA